METGAQPKVDKRFLHQTAADTLMGQLLRKFWHPVALSTDLKAGSACPVRVLGENLTLYRGRSGRPYLIGGRCAHRCSVLHTGVIDDEQIRCMYHGWRYNGDGVCTDMPAEKKQRPTTIKIAGYPAHEYAGLIFAYLGQEPVPEFDLPRKDVFEDDSRHVFAKREVWDCNWFQQIENSLDAVHLSFAHMWGSTEQFGLMAAGGGEIPELAYSETDSGVRQIATRSNGNVRISDWTFPNNNHIVVPGPNKSDPWPHVSVWAVPVDDTRTMRFRLCSLQGRDLANRELIESSQKFDPSQHAERLFRGDLAGITDQALISAQDYVAVRGQGEIVDRTQENLSSSDIGVVFLRRLFLRELEAIQQGRATKQWARPSEFAPSSIAAGAGRRVSRWGIERMKTFSTRQCAYAIAITSVSICTALAGTTAGAMAQDYPAPGRSIRIIVPAAAGGALDMMGRVLAQRTTDIWKRQAYVENRPGANWIIGMDAVVRSEPDGYTLLVVSSAGLSVNPSVFPNIPFDPFRDLVPVASLTRGTFVLLANPSLPVNTASEFIRYLKANPGKLNHGSNSATTILLSALFKSLAKVDYVDVNYKGASQAINDTMAGVIQFCFTDFGSALPAIQGGKLKPLAVASAARYSLVPEIPALADDLPGFAMDGGMILLAPGKTPRSVVDKLNGFVSQALASDEIRQRIATMGQLPGDGTPEQIQTSLRSEADKWKTLIKEQGIRFQQ